MAEFEDKKHGQMSLSDLCIGKETNAVLDDFQKKGLAIAQDQATQNRIEVSHGTVVAALSQSASSQAVERIHIADKSQLKDFSTKIKELAERKKNGHSCADDLVLAWEKRSSRAELHTMSEVLIHEAIKNDALLPLVPNLIKVHQAVAQYPESHLDRIDNLIKASATMPEMVEFIEALNSAREVGIKIHLAAGNYRDTSDRDSNSMALALNRGDELVGAVKSNKGLIEDYSRDGYGIRPNTYHTGTHLTQITPEGVDLDNDGKTDLTFSEIIVENPQTCLLYTSDAADE